MNSVWNLKALGGYSTSKLSSPTREIALFLYSGSYSPGVFLLKLLSAFSSFLGTPEVQIAISRPGTDPRVTATAKNAGGSFDGEVTLSCDLLSTGPIRLKETYQSLKSPLGEFQIPKALQYSRPLYVTYLDDDLLVLRDESGVPEVRNFHYRSIHPSSLVTNSDPSRRCIRGWVWRALRRKTPVVWTSVTSWSLKRWISGISLSMMASKRTRMEKS